MRVVGRWVPHRAVRVFIFCVCQRSTLAAAGCLAEREEQYRRWQGERCCVQVVLGGRRSTLLRWKGSVDRKGAHEHPS